MVIGQENITKSQDLTAIRFIFFINILILGHNQHGYLNPNHFEETRTDEHLVDYMYITFLRLH